MRFLVALPLFLLACERNPGPSNTPPPEQKPSVLSAGEIEAGADKDQKVRAAGDGRIAFVQDGQALCTMAPDGADVRTVVKGDGSWIGHPAWSPNRKWIAFAWATKAERHLYRRNLFIVRPDGSDVRQVTPMPLSGVDLTGGPTARVAGQAMIPHANGPLGMESFDVAAYGVAAPARTTRGGRFEISVPATTVWLKISGVHEGVRYSATRMGIYERNQEVNLGDVVLSPDAEQEAVHPAWSADGHSLYFVLTAVDARARNSVCRIGLNGGNFETVAGDARYDALAFDLAAHRLVVRRREHGKAVVLWIDPVKRRPTDQKDCGFSGDAFALHPDGRTVLCAALDEKLNQTLKSGDTELARLTPESGTFRKGDYAPDGKDVVVEVQGELRARRGGQWITIGKGGDPAWAGR